jgi:hypothetical protein
LSSNELSSLSNMMWIVTNGCIFFWWSLHDLFFSTENWLSHASSIFINQQSLIQFYTGVAPASATADLS